MSDSLSTKDIEDLFARPLLDLLLEAQTIHRKWHRPNEVQLSTLLSIKTGGCPEDCGYCSQSAFAHSGLKASKLLELDEVREAATSAKNSGATRFCMGAAWREPRDRDIPKLRAMIGAVNELGLETCMTLGMLSDWQAEQLADAGLDYYNHNLDTSPEYYGEVITTRTYQDRLDTLARVRAAGIAVCCGGILGMGESRADRISFLHALRSLPVAPESIPLNALVPVTGTALGDSLKRGDIPKIDEIEFVRTIAVTRILMPKSVVRLSAGRESFSETMQALCFMAGANSIFTGDRLLTTENCGSSADADLFGKLGLWPSEVESRSEALPA